MKILFTIVLLIMLQQFSFKETQQKHARVKSAYDDKEYAVQQLFASRNLRYDGFHLFLRALKKEMKLEVWIRERGKDTYALLHHYNFCTTSGSLGPKRKEGDLQIPEGIYQINHFNPQSNFHLSLGINYPNASDKVLSDPEHPGGSIYIHGSCATIGCIPITDDKIKELYIIAVEARNNGQQKIPIHIFPSALDNTSLAILKETYSARTDLQTFWMNLQSIYQDFEDTRMLKKVNVDAKGQYFY